MTLIFSVLQTFYSKKASQVKFGDGGITGNLDQVMFTDTKKEYEAAEIFQAARTISKERKFKESFEVIVKLNVDPTQGD